MATMIKCDCCGDEKNAHSGSPAFYKLDATKDTNVQHHILNIDVCERCYNDVLKVLSLKGDNYGK